VRAAHDREARFERVDLAGGGDRPMHAPELMGREVKRRLRRGDSTP
jgi:hypothetical protein